MEDEVKKVLQHLKTFSGYFKIAQSHTVGGHKSSMVWLCYFNILRKAKIIIII